MPLDPVTDIARLDLAALRDLCAELLATVKVLENRVQVLEARPPVVIPPYPQMPQFDPFRLPPMYPQPIWVSDNTVPPSYLEITCASHMIGSN